MKVKISNRIYIKNPTWDIQQFCMEELVVTNPEYETMIRIGKEDMARMRHIPPKLFLYIADNASSTLILPYGCLYAIWKYIKDCEITTEFNENGTISCITDKIEKPLYDYQETAVNKMCAAKGGVLVGGCGSGKTNCGIAIVQRIGKKFLWLTHTLDLVKQSYTRFKELFPNMKIAITSDGKINFGEDGTIATVQTMAALDPEIYKDKFDLVICDECHRVVNSPVTRKLFGKVVSAIPARYKYGLTATPKRNDSMTKTIYTTLGCNTLGEFAPVFEISKKDTKTLVAKHEMVALDTPFSYEMLNSDGTFNYGGLVDYLANYEPRNNFIVDKVASLVQEGRKQLILCLRVSQCELLQQKLKDKGINAYLLTGKVTAKKRNQILSGEIPWDVIVATISLAKEGLDVPILDTLHIVSNIGNKTDTVQSVGRIERICEGKKDPIVYDYVDMEIPYCISRYNKRAGWLKRR